MATQVPNQRFIRDANLSVTKALPSTSSNNTSGQIDIGAGPFNPEQITIEVALPAMPLHVTAGNKLQIQLYSSATSGSGDAITSPIVEFDQIGIASTGTGAQVFTAKLPPGTARYISFHNITGGTDDLSSYTATYSILL